MEKIPLPIFLFPQSIVSTLLQPLRCRSIVAYDTCLLSFTTINIVARVGGLPAAVSNFAEEHSFIGVEQIHHDLLSSYRDDFSKYAGRLSLNRLDELLNKLPFFLGKKFIYQHVNKEVSTAAIKQALQLLIKAKMCSPIYCTSANGVPLAAEIRDREFKMAFLDVGLASTALGLKTKTPLDLINQGPISEQIVAQLLRTINPFYVEPALYYWAREEKGASAELDYVIAHEGEIIPIEVKAGSTGSLKSLHVFMGLKKRKLAVRINSELPSVVAVEVKSPMGEFVKYNLLSLPFYLTEEICRLIDQVAIVKC